LLSDILIRIGEIILRIAIFDDLEREPFYDGIDFEVPFEKELSKDYVFVKRLAKNSFIIELKKERND